MKFKTLTLIALVVIIIVSSIMLVSCDNSKKNLDVKDSISVNDSTTIDSISVSDSTGIITGTTDSN